jgi:hypothetical protein
MQTKLSNGNIMDFYIYICTLIIIQISALIKVKLNSANADHGYYYVLFIKTILVVLE